MEEGRNKKTKGYTWVIVAGFTAALAAIFAKLFELQWFTGAVLISRIKFADWSHLFMGERWALSLLFYIGVEPICWPTCKVVRELSGMILSRGPKLCNFVEWRGFKVVYKRYASLYFCMCVNEDDNELEIREIIHHFLDILDRYFGSVCELDFNKYI